MPPIPKRTGRPKKKLDEKRIEKMAKDMSTLEEISFALNVGRSTLARRFGKKIRAWREGAAKVSLRRRLMHVALHEDSKAAYQVLIHLSKHYLDMHDKPKVVETSFDFAALSRSQPTPSPMEKLEAIEQRLGIGGNGHSKTKVPKLGTLKPAQ